MKTQAEADAYLKSVKRWKDEHGDVADPGEKHVELYRFKETLDLSQHKAEFVETTSDMAYKKDSRGWVDEDIGWSMDLGDFGRVYLHLYCTPEVEDMGTWAEFWFKDEPWWNGDDPYECTMEQIAAIVRALPEEHRQKYVELASRSEEVVAFLSKIGALEGSEQRPSA